MSFFSEMKDLPNVVAARENSATLTLWNPANPRIG